MTATAQRRTHTARPTTVLVAAGLGLVLLLSGCSSDETAAATASAEEEVGPLMEYYEQLYAAPSQEQMDAGTREREALITTCMQEQGFEYRPIDPATDGSSPLHVGVGVGEGVDWDSEEYAATEGYGATTSDDSEEPAEEYVDPNEDYVAAMSESERMAYEEALHGSRVEYDENAAEEDYEYDWTTAGCRGAADHEVTGDQPDDDPAFSSVMEQMYELYENLLTEPRMVALDGEWASCMADAGYTGFTTQQDAAESIYEASTKLYESADNGEEYVEPDAAALDELRQRELDTAVADARCREEVDYLEQEQELRFALEQEFVDAHRAELEALVAAHGQGS